jgi:hypothetical protein
MSQETDTLSSESLDRRPEARAFKVEDLLAELRQGRMRIPSFQRGIRWKRQDAATLVDSLYRGFPIGTLLFWETHAEAGDVAFGTVRFGGGARNDALWVVDGQQRLMSLARVLLALQPDKDEFALYFDLDRGVFVSPPPGREADPSRWLPMTEILDSEKLMQWVFAYTGENKERRERAFNLGRRIREYEIPAYLVKTDREETLREIFGRINSTGKKLGPSEVFDALHGARAQSRPATLSQVAAELEHLDFGRIEEKLLYRLLRALQGHDVIERKEEGPLRLTDAQAETAYRETAEAARRVIQFLIQDVGIQRYDLLPYKQPFVMLGKFFHFHPSPHPRSRALLARWVWRGALNGAHRGDTVSTTANLERIIQDGEEASVQRLLAMAARQPDALPDVNAAFNFRFAASKLQALAMLDLQPRDLESGEAVYVGQYVGLEEHEFPMATLITRHGSGHADQQSAANRLIHPPRPKLRRLLLQATDPAVLASHGVSPAAHRALAEDDVEGFLRLRADLLRAHFARFFARHARWDETDRPSLSALLAEDEAH